MFLPRFSVVIKTLQSKKKKRLLYLLDQQNDRFKNATNTNHVFKNNYIVKKSCFFLYT